MTVPVLPARNVFDSARAERERRFLRARFADSYTDARIAGDDPTICESAQAMRLTDEFAWREAMDRDV